MNPPRKIMLPLAMLALLGALNLSAQNIALPGTPFYLETFDQVQEGSLPTGWSVQNFTDEGNPWQDLDDPRSDSYKDWVVISRDRLVGLGDSGALGAGRRLDVNPDQFVNGVTVTNLISGNFAYAESDVRGGSQVQYLFSPDFNASGETNIFLFFHSIYEQNQDSIGSVEYSIDGGATWEPILYMIDRPDVILDARGEIDAVATLTTVRDDIAKYLDPVTGEDRGSHYGAFIGVSSNRWSTLAPHISARVDDDAIESKRVELFRLPLADNQARVRLRFAQAGTASWYFGIDNVSLYSIQQAQPPGITRSPESQWISAGSRATLSVVATGESLRYQWKFNGNNLADETNPTLTLNDVRAAQAGEYQVIVTEPGGDTPSAVARIQVFSGTITQDLVTHLAFENDLIDSSGRSNNGYPVGSPTFSDGKIGRALHLTAEGDYVSLEAPADLGFGTDVSFSISFWAKLTDWGGDPSFISNKDWNSGGNQGFVLATDDDGRLQWNLAGPPGGRKDYDGPGGAFSAPNWRHVAVTFDRSGNATTFIDSQIIDSRPLNTDQNDVSTPDGNTTNIGQDGTGFYGPSFANAEFDDVGIWRRLLTVQEVQAIYNAGLTGMDLAQAAVSGPAIMPSITAQPQNVSITANATASFTVTVGGSQPLSYQWKLNGADIPGANSSTLSLPNVQPANAGAYTVAASNAAGSVTSAPAILTVNVPAPSAVTGQWDFEQGDLQATVGSALEYQGPTAAGATFTQMQIGGQPARVMGFPATTIEEGYVMRHGAAANGGGANVNQYTLILDLMYPEESNRQWRALLQTDPTNASDGDLFINAGNGVGISGQYQGTITAGAWHRVAVVFDLTTATLKEYVDGALVNAQNLGDSGGVDQRWSLQPTALLFADEDNETSPGFVNSIQFRSGLMSDAEISALGTPTAAGIPRPQAGVQLGTVSRNGNNLTLTWSGGTGPFTIQRKASLSDPAWTTVSTTAERTASVPIEGNNGFFRVSDGHP